MGAPLSLGDQRKLGLPEHLALMRDCPRLRGLVLAVRVPFYSRFCVTGA